MSDKLKYLGYSIVFQEVPDEVTLAINISGCPHKCEGCHSKYLWGYDGHYVMDDLSDLIKQYTGLITCVCFMGGDQNLEELSLLALMVNKYNLKSALYTGVSDISREQKIVHAMFDYVKIGPYIEEFGGLDKPTTNQRMYRQINKPSDIWEDITYRFWKEEKTSGNN